MSSTTIYILGAIGTFILYMACRRRTTWGVRFADGEDVHAGDDIMVPVGTDGARRMHVVSTNRDRTEGEAVDHADMRASLVACVLASLFWPFVLTFATLCGIVGILASIYSDIRGTAKVEAAPEPEPECFKGHKWRK